MGGQRTWTAIAAVGAVALCLAGSAAGTEGAGMRSGNWSGYILDGGPFDVTSAVFNVPNLTAAAGRTSTSEWVGVDGSDPTDDSLIQAGVRETYDPHSNTVELHVWWEILPAVEQAVRLPVAVGDRVGVSIGRVSPGRWRIDIRNHTRGGRFVVTRPYDGPGRTADWIVEAPALYGSIQRLGHYVPSVTFGDVRASGAQRRLHALTMVQGGAVVSSVTKLTPHGFSVAYR